MLLLVQCLYVVLFNYVNVCIGSQSSAGLEKLWLELWYVPSHRFTGGFSACHEAPQDQRTVLTRLRAGWTAVFPYLLLFSPEKNLGKVIHHFLTCAACFHTGWLMPLKFNATLQTQGTSGEILPKKWWNGGFGRQSLGNWRMKYDELRLFCCVKTGTPGRWIPGTHGDAFRETMDINKPQQQRQRYKLLRFKNLSPIPRQILSPNGFQPLFARSLSTFPRFVRSVGTPTWGANGVRDLGVGQKTQGFLEFNWPILEYSVFHTPSVRLIQKLVTV